MPRNVPLMAPITPHTSLHPLPCLAPRPSTVTVTHLTDRADREMPYAPFSWVSLRIKCRDPGCSLSVYLSCTGCLALPSAGNVTVRLKTLQ